MSQIKKKNKPASIHFYLFTNCDLKTAGEKEVRLLLAPSFTLSIFVFYLYISICVTTAIMYMNMYVRVYIKKADKTDSRSQWSPV